MTRTLVAPNPKNASLGDLQAALRASNRKTNRRGMVVIMLLTGSPREQVMRAPGLSDRVIQKIVRARNVYGIIAQPWLGRPPVLGPEQKAEILEEFEEPGRANRTFWIATASHDHPAEELHTELLLRHPMAPPAREGLPPEGAAAALA